jgi:hypothetical protein
VALPLSPPERVAAASVRGGERQLDGRHPGRGIAVGRCRPARLEDVSQVLALLVGCVGKQATGCITVVGGDDQAASSGESPDKGPERIVVEAGNDVGRERRDALPWARQIMSNRSGLGLGGAVESMGGVGE